MKKVDENIIESLNQFESISEECQISVDGGCGHVEWWDNDAWATAWRLGLCY